MNTTIDFVTGINHPKSSKAYPFELMQTVANSVAQCSYRHSHALIVKILRMSYNAPTMKFRGGNLKFSNYMNIQIF